MDFYFTPGDMFHDHSKFTDTTNHKNRNSTQTPNSKARTIHNGPIDGQFEACHVGYGGFKRMTDPALTTLLLQATTCRIFTLMLLTKGG